MLKEMIQKTIEQGQGSFVPIGDKQVKCLYRNPEGLKCAVGQIIPDELYTHDMESMRVSDICSVIGIPCEGVYTEVQVCHDWACEDEGDFVENFKVRLKKCADMGKLPKEVLEWI